MRLLLVALLLIALPVRADDYQALYDAAGWPVQREHFDAALGAAQARYRSSLPAAVFQALVDNSNRRFAPQAVDRRALEAFRRQLPQPAEALAFFGSDTGRKIVAAETRATSPADLAKHANGIPRLDADSTRRLQIRHLVQAIPAGEAGAEVSLALAGVAADSLSSMLPGLLGGMNPAQGLLEGQRQRLVEQIEADMDNTLLYVYRDLSDAELEEFVQFAQSSAGQAYYKAALQALRAGLSPPPAAPAGSTTTQAGQVL